MTATSLDLTLAGLSAPGMTREPARATSWAGKWFKIVEQECGEFIGMRFARCPAGDAAPEWIFRSHAAGDGVGWFSALLRQQTGAEVGTPRLKEERKPPLRVRIHALLELLKREPHPAAAWKTSDAGWRPPPGGAKASTAVAVHAFSADETCRLAERARREGASLNSLLLATLARVCRPELEGRHVYWMMPVNMRGPVKMATETESHTAYLQVDTGACPSARQLHEKVKSKLARREHWGAWAFINAGRIFRFSGMKRIYRRELARTEGRPWTGAFSNLGSWESGGVWFFAPPVTKTCPLGVGAVTCDGCLTLTVDAHASIATDAAWSRTLMDHWLAELRA